MLYWFSINKKPTIIKDYHGFLQKYQERGGATMVLRIKISRSIRFIKKYSQQLINYSYK